MCAVCGLARRAPARLGVSPSLTSARSLSLSLSRKAECRICACPAEAGLPLLSPCACSGTARHVHASCLAHWVRERGAAKAYQCEVCLQEYAVDAGSPGSAELKEALAQSRVAAAEEGARRERRQQAGGQRAESLVWGPEAGQTLSANEMALLGALAAELEMLQLRHARRRVELQAMTRSLRIFAVMALATLAAMSVFAQSVGKIRIYSILLLVGILSLALVARVMALSRARREEASAAEMARHAAQNLQMAVRVRPGAGQALAAALLQSQAHALRQGRDSAEGAAAGQATRIVVLSAAHA